jgi:hypothetical protein
LAESDTASVAGAGSLPAVRSKTFAQKYKPTFVRPDLQKIAGRIYIKRQTIFCGKGYEKPACGCDRMAQVAVFQTDDTGSIPVARLRSRKLHVQIVPDAPTQEAQTDWRRYRS